MIKTSLTDIIARLRQETQAPIQWCKKAVDECGVDIDKAKEWLKKKGIVKSISMQTREATDGAVFAYVHTNNRIGVLVEVNCQTDFVARTDDFRNFCKDVAMHIAGRDPFPLYVSDEEIPADAVANERRIQTEKAQDAGKGKPENIIAKIVDGTVAKWKKDICLLDQEFVKDPTKDIRTLMLELSAKTGEKVTIRRFTRYALGEGMQKKSDDFATEVAAQVAASTETAR